MNLCMYERIKMDKYIFNKEIGSGSFGKVFLVESKQTGIQYVIKQIDLNKLDKKQSSSAPKEVEVLSKLKHNNIVCYKESFEENKYLNIVMEHCENGDLHRKIKEKRISNEYFDEDEILDYFVQICLALEYIHDQRILHRDLKSKNIFLTKGNVIKLGDFGIAKVLENSLELAQTCIGSPFYISPEICENKPYDKKSDIWALGCVLYELSTLKYAFIAKNMKFLLTRIITGVYSPVPNYVNVQIRNLISVLLKPNPKDRPTAAAILKKPFLQKYVSKYSCEIKKTNLNRARSKSGENFRSSLDSRNTLRNRVLSSSCLKLNDSKKFLTKPETKYDPQNKHRRKLQREDSRNYLEINAKPVNYLNNVSKLKINSKLPKVDSQYYNLIAENSERKENNKNNKCSEQNTFAPSDITSKFLVNNKIENKINDKEMEDPWDGEVFLDAEDKMSNLIDNEISSEAMRNIQDNRKKWIANTFDRGKLIEILSEADLINSSCLNTVLQASGDNLAKKPTVDDLLRLDPNEFCSEVLTPIQAEPIQQYENKNSGIDYHEMLKQEINEIKKRYKENHQNYRLMDLVKLTENSRRILILQVCRKFTRGDGESQERKENVSTVFFNLEMRRMQLEKDVGLYLFLKTYRKMMSILNGDFSIEGKIVNGSETYTVTKSGDEIQCLKNAWTDVIDLLDDKKKYLPDIWELTISENICYQE